jgi:hypothetical protein
LATKRKHWQLIPDILDTTALRLMAKEQASIFHLVMGDGKI